MLSTYRYPKYAYTRPPEVRSRTIGRYPLVIVGAGPVGMATAIDCALHGLPVLLIDDDNTVSVGSRGVCYAKRALEIFDRLGCAHPMVAKGVSWNVGRTFHRDDEVYRFELQPEADHHRPGMINLQQYYLEDYLVRRVGELPLIETRWENKVIVVEQRADSVRLEIETPDGTYAIEAEWLVAADGARSRIRNMLGLDVEGQVFMDRFLIADVVMKADFPTERWFWFDPPFHRGQSVLLHRQADNVWRIDFQLGWDADPELEKKPERVTERIKAMLGPQREFELEWVSVYTFQCRRMARFRDRRVLFVGDAAHQVSPFGARGCNSGIQDADNLVWKLALVVAGNAPQTLLDTYSDERVYAADENIANSTRSTDFITPKSEASLDFRNAVLTLARRFPFARSLVNSGRLSVPAILSGSALNTPDAEPFAGKMVPGAPTEDAPVHVDGRDDWLLAHVGNRFVVLLFVEDAAAIDAATIDSLAALSRDAIAADAVVVASRPSVRAGVKTLHDVKGVVAKRYDAWPGTTYVVRPDQHVAARFRAFDSVKVRQAIARATCNL
jgi:3-(3-hydroxy-phenyl)propionate hydroxylase